MNFGIVDLGLRAWIQSVGLRLAGKDDIAIAKISVLYAPSPRPGTRLG
jgi:hypothetical protein